MRLKHTVTTIFLYLLLIVGTVFSSSLFAQTSISGLPPSPVLLFTHQNEEDYYTRNYPRDAVPFLYDITSGQKGNNMLFRDTFTISTNWRAETNQKLSLKFNTSLFNTGIQIDGHTVFKSDDNDSIGFIFDIGLTQNLTDLQPVTQNQTTITTNITLQQTCSLLRGCSYSSSSNISLRVRPVVFKPILVGSDINLPTQKVATISVNTDSSTSTSFDVLVRNFRLVNRPYTCKLSNFSSSNTLNVTLKDAMVTTLLNTGQADGAQFQIFLNCKDGIDQSTGVTFTPITNIYAVMTDQNNPANRSNILTLMTNGKENPSVGLQITKSDQTPIFFGPASSNKGTENQWLFASNSSRLNGTNPSMSFTAKYILRNRPIVTGPVIGTATITFSYQ